LTAHHPSLAAFPQGLRAVLICRLQQDRVPSALTRFPWLRHVFADGGYAGPKLRNAMASHGTWTIEIIKRSDTAKGFEILPRRWVVERTFAWLGRCRRLAKDWETSVSPAPPAFRAIVRRAPRRRPKNALHYAERHTMPSGRRTPRFAKALPVICSA
jgi:transposase